MKRIALRLERLAAVRAGFTVNLKEVGNAGQSSRQNRRDQGQGHWRQGTPTQRQSPPEGGQGQRGRQSRCLRHGALSEGDEALSFRNIAGIVVALILLYLSAPLLVSRGMSYLRPAS